MRRNFKRLLLKSEQTVMPETIMKVSIVSDLHINPVAVDDESFPNFSNPPMYFYTIGQKLEQYVNHVNQQQPDTIINLGDIIDGINYGSSFDLFRQYWDMIDPTIKKSISAGNHDYQRISGGYLSHDYVAEKLGYSNRPIIAGSKMNESFSVYKDDLGVRFINFDSNMTETGSFSSAGSYLSDVLIAWIKTELLNSDEQIALLYSHRGMGFIEQQSWENLQTMLLEVSDIKPELKMYLFYGHSHVADIKEYRTPISNTPIYNITALVDNIESEFYTFNISENGIQSIDTHWAKYP